MALDRRMKDGGEFLFRQFKFLAYELQVLRQILGRIGRLFQFCHGGGAGHLPGQDKARQMGAPLVVSEPLWQPVGLEELGEAGFEMLGAVFLPTHLAGKQGLGGVLVVGDEIQWLDDLHAGQEAIRRHAVVQKQSEHRHDRQGLQRPRAELFVYGANVPVVAGSVLPGPGQNAFRRDVVARQDVADLVPCGEAEQLGEDGVVLRRVLVGDAGFQKGDLQVAHLFPINDESEQIQAQFLDQAFDGAHRVGRIPTRVDMDQKRAQSPFLDRQPGQVG